MQQESKIFNLIICTYKRPDSLRRLLESVALQTLYPEKILIIDGSPSLETKQMLAENNFQNTEYYKVEEKDRGLTKQRNFGVGKVNSECEIVCFLDDDIILAKIYFEELIGTYTIFPEALGVSGYITNETDWKKNEPDQKPPAGIFYFDGWNRVEGSRFALRRKFGLAPDKVPGFMPDFSHGYSTGFLPPSGKVYEAEMLMGGIASYKTSVLKKLQFSSYFEGYGLYEDADFSLRVSKIGKLYVNTSAKLEHHHDQEGRPDKYKYGKMVVRNGWYVWRIKYPKPVLRAKLKWYATALLLTFVRIGNIFTTAEKKEAFSESLGRLVGLTGVLFYPPKRYDA
ncbi:glycosyltransferase family 2 protein [Zunongwangia sp. F363]|uniref:Glycosyltransferase family 2 protein n=1 Tax=Autumnicola tepida TaxID=3075595 RepID=A0ABU3CAF6_9FLAO|nr:glycosyltransferase family 2 protein [Zunongwangia sp. F363]MDT0643030.1 glycosyltransferase family 2 protein [Zunongwangia sp. F363]